MNSKLSAWWAIGVAACLATAVPALAQTEPDSTSTDETDLLDLLPELSCKELLEVFYEEIPHFVYDDQPDGLYELVIFASDQCDLGEPLTRTQILASIWDDNFQEIIYGYEIIDALTARYDTHTQPKAGSAQAVFDTFTIDFANQMLPHVPKGSLEEFFCLFYAGQPAVAWELLQSEDLEDTWLRYYYDEEVDILSRTESPYIIGGYWGGWSPGGNMEFVGPKQIAGMSVEQWASWGFLRVVIEGRIGRADAPYFVNQKGFSGFSDRWDALLFALEGGVGVWDSGPHLAEVFLGVGFDVLQPFKDEDISPASVNVSLGAGYRWYPQRSRRWYLRADGRFEYVGTRNRGGTELDGPAFSARLGLGISLAKDPQPRLNALGQTP